MSKYIISDESFKLIDDMSRIISSRWSRPVGIAMDRDQYKQIARQMEITTGNRPSLVCFGLPVKIISDSVMEYVGDSAKALIIYDRRIWDIINGDDNDKNS